MEMYRVQNVALVVTTIILAMGTLLEAIRCYSCQGMADNEDCNAHVTECTRDVHDTCYTKIKELDGGGRVFKKGCEDWNRCNAMDIHQSSNTCNSFSGECVYCCNSASNCNEGATSTALTNTPLVSTYTLALMCCFVKFIFWR